MATLERNNHQTRCFGRLFRRKVKGEQFISSHGSKTPFGRNAAPEGETPKQRSEFSQHSSPSRNNRQKSSGCLSVFSKRSKGSQTASGKQARSSSTPFLVTPRYKASDECSTDTTDTTIGRRATSPEQERMEKNKEEGAVNNTPCVGRMSSRTTSFYSCIQDIDCGASLSGGSVLVDPYPKSPEEISLSGEEYEFHSALEDEIDDSFSPVGPPTPSFEIIEEGRNQTTTTTTTKGEESGCEKEKRKTCESLSSTISTAAPSSNSFSSPEVVAPDCPCGFNWHSTIFNPDFPLFTSPNVAPDSFDEGVMIARSCSGKWETILERSESLDSQYRQIGLGMVKRAVMNRLAIQLTMFLEENDTIFHCWIHTPIGIRHLRSNLCHDECVDDDPDAGRWTGVTHIVDFSIPWYCGGKTVRAIQQRRTNPKVGTSIESRVVLPDQVEGRVMLFQFMMIPKGKTEKECCLKADRVLKYLGPIG